jgi:hypothetical protein
MTTQVAAVAGRPDEPDLAGARDRAQLLVPSARVLAECGVQVPDEQPFVVLDIPSCCWIQLD